MNTAIQLVDAKTSANSGNTYYPVKLALKRQDGTVESRDATVIINSRWALAQQEALKTKTRNKQPTMNILVSDMEREEGDYDGTGSVWMRRKGLHIGSFKFDGTTYSATISRKEAEEGQEAGPLELVLEEILPVSINDL